VSRAVSTVVDTLLCLLLVSAATLVVTAPAGESVGAPADETVEVVATSTTTVEYEPGGETGGPRHAQGTYAGLLARAAVANATLDGRQLVPAGPTFAAQVREETATVLGTNVQVSARWAPYPGAPVSGRVTVGPDPPPRADVRVARFRVPVAVPAVEPERTYDSVARQTAAAITQGFVPQDVDDLPLDKGRWRGVSHRVNVLAGPESTPASPNASAENARAARAVATDALAAVVADDLRGRFDSPGDASGALTTGTATVVVRRWDE